MGRERKTRGRKADTGKFIVRNHEVDQSQSHLLSSYLQLAMEEADESAHKSGSGYKVEEESGISHFRISLEVLVIDKGQI
jgi:hypothetical protein